VGVLYDYQGRGDDDGDGVDWGVTVPNDFFSRGDGPLGQLYLTMREVEVLRIGLEMLAQVDMKIWADQGRAHPEAPARADQVVAAARDRVSITRSLQTALAELQISLQRQVSGTEETGP
jgi:hypothetical protein